MVRNPKITVNSEIFASILFSRIAFKDIFATLKIGEPGNDFATSVKDKESSPFREGFIFANSAFAKFRESKILAKISKFTDVFLASRPMS